MSFKGLIRAQLNNAFKLAKDFAVDATLLKKGAASFNFGTGMVETSVAVPVVTKLIFLKEDGKVTETVEVAKTALLRTKGIGDLSLYDKFNVEQSTWRIGEVLSQNDLVAIVKIFKEASNG